MSLELKQVLEDTKSAFERWRLLTDLIHRSEAMISISVSRVERGSRLRSTADQIPTDKTAAVMVKTAGYEAEAYAYLAVIPGYYRHFDAELVKVRSQIEGGIAHE